MTVPATLKERETPEPAGFYCNARRRQDEGVGSDGLCRQRAGWGTDHPGVGRCKLHGGSSRTVHGLYSQHTRHRLADRIKELRESEDLLNLREQIALQTAVVQEYLSSIDSEVQLSVKDAKLIVDLVDLASRNIERLNNVEERTSLKTEEVELLLLQIVQVVKLETNQKTAERIGRRLLGLARGEELRLTP